MTSTNVVTFNNPVITN